LSRIRRGLLLRQRPARALWPRRRHGARGRGAWQRHRAAPQRPKGLRVRIATRGSALALTQARWVAERLGSAELVEASSDGEPGDKSRFVRGVERVLLAGEAEI